MKHIGKFSLGIGDRFAHEGSAQLRALTSARETGISVTPVWNKSHREHTLVKSTPSSARSAADKAVTHLGWKDQYHVDADHVGAAVIDTFIPECDFFTLDVADFVGKPAQPDDLARFLDNISLYRGTVRVPGIQEPFEISDELLRRTAGKYLLAVREAARTHGYICTHKDAGFVTEVSMDETDVPQSPVELLLILAMLATERVPVQSIAPKFTGRFNKGVDYVGDIDRFEKEFDEDLAVVEFAIREFGLPSTLKLSVHSGSDKFSLYPVINRLLKKHEAGLHLKTAGTTWLEEIIGLAEAGGDGLELAKDIYAGAFARAGELIAPYAPVVDISVAGLPAPQTVREWSSRQFAAALRHDQTCRGYDRQFRQFMHVSFKIAAELGSRFTNSLVEYSDTIGRNVTHNLLHRHIIPLFG